MARHWRTGSAVTFLVLGASLAAVATPAGSQQVVAGLAGKIADLIENRDARALSGETRTLLFWQERLSTPKPSISRIEPAQLFDKLNGCPRLWVAEEYGEIKWVCRDRPVVDRDCFDQAIVASAKHYSKGVGIVFRPSEEWSVKRCGKAPLFVPPPPPKKD